MSSLKESDVEHIAKLARLSLTKEEINKYQKDLSSILSHFEELSEVNIENIEPTSQTTGLTDVFRNDQIDPLRVLSADDAVGEAPDTFNNYFKVPPILEK